MNLDAFFQLNDEMSDDILQFINGDGLTERLYDSLFSYYCSTGEMPYGVAKARTGDPYEWIDSEFTNFVEKLLSASADTVKFTNDGFMTTSITSN